jgi:hypothetical protein
MLTLLDSDWLPLIDFDHVVLKYLVRVVV